MVSYGKKCKTFEWFYLNMVLLGKTCKICEWFHENVVRLAERDTKYVMRYLCEGDGSKESHSDCFIETYRYKADWVVV